MIVPGAVGRGIRRAYSQSGMYRNDGSLVPLWTVDWYAFKVDIASDGVHLIRHGPWATFTHEEAISFFANGQLLRTHLIQELVDDDTKLRRSVSHFLWREDGRFDDAAFSYALKTKDGNRFVFDARTGEIVSAPRAGTPKIADCARTFCGCWADTVLEFTTTILAGGKPVSGVEIRCDKEDVPVAVSDAAGVARFTLPTARSPGCHFARCTNLTLRDRTGKHGDLRLTVFRANGKLIRLGAGEATGGVPGTRSPGSTPRGAAPQAILYHLNAQTVADARVQGTVFANRWTWKCRGKRCDSRIPGRGRFADLCAALAAEVGPLHACDAGYARLSAPEVEKINRAMPAGSPEIPAQTSTRFSLLREEGALWLVVDGGRERLAVPAGWILSPDEEARENDGYVSTIAFERQVQEFAVGNGSIALRASSYETSGGAANAAAGRDVFLVFDPGGRKVAEGSLRLGVTKRRLRANGVPYATTHRLYAQDIDGDGLVDIGTVREQASCHAGHPTFTSDRVRWHVFRDGRWIHDRARDGTPPRSSRAAELPLLGLVKSPVDYLLERCVRS
jgi:hypothetical protein